MSDVKQQNKSKNFNGCVLSEPFLSFTYGGIRLMIKIEKRSPYRFNLLLSFDVKSAGTVMMSAVYTVPVCHVMTTVPLEQVVSATRLADVMQSKKNNHSMQI